MEYILFIGLLVYVIILSARVKKLENSLSVYKKELHSSNQERLQQSQQVTNQQPVNMGSEATPHQSGAPTPSYVRNESMSSKQEQGSLSGKFSAWIKDDWMMKLGAMLLLVGFGWLTTYAFLNNWIGPVGRIAIGLVVGAGFLALGTWRIRRFLHQGGIFLVLGSTIVLMTTFAGKELYNFFTPISALALMFLSTLFVSVASVKFKSQSLALAGLILAGLAPILTGIHAWDYVALFMYLTVIVLSTVWIVFLTGKRSLTLASLIIVSLYLMPYVAGSLSANDETLLLFVFLFAAIFFATNIAGILKPSSEGIYADVLTAGFNGLLLLVSIMALVPDTAQSLVISAWTLVFIISGFIVFMKTRNKNPFYVYVGVGVVMLAAATAIELQGAALTIAYIVEISVMIFVTYAISKDVKLTEKLSLLFVGPMVLSLESIGSSAWNSGVIHKDFFVLVILLLALIIIGVFFVSKNKGLDEKDKTATGSGWVIVGSVYIYTVAWLSLHALYYPSLAVMIALVFYTIVGLVCYFMGHSRDNKVLRVYGGIMIGLVVGRLILVDVWRMDLGGRIITFFIIGSLLVGTAFFGRKKTTEQLSSNPNNYEN